MTVSDQDDLLRERSARAATILHAQNGTSLPQNGLSQKYGNDDEMTSLLSLSYSECAQGCTFTHSSLGYEFNILLSLAAGSYREST